MIAPKRTAVSMGNKTIGENRPMLIVAEAGANHLGNLELAKRLIEKAHESGADAIKFQIFKPETLTISTTPVYGDLALKQGSKTQFEMFEKSAKFTLDDWKTLMDHAGKVGISMFATPFDLEAVEILEQIGAPFYKIASADIVYPQLLKKVAVTGKPIIMSTGAATTNEIDEAVNVCRLAGNNQIILLHCTLTYPTEDQDAHLRIITGLREHFPGLNIGLSDHTWGPLLPAIAVALGACVIEKHFTLSHHFPGSGDHIFGLTPEEFKHMVTNIRRAETALGQTTERIHIVSEERAQKQARRSVSTVVDIPKETVITPQMLAVLRPGSGIPPKEFDKVIGKKTKKRIPAGTTLTWKLLS